MLIWFGDGESDGHNDSPRIEKLEAAPNYTKKTNVITNA